MKIKVLAIAPYPGLKDLLQQVSKEDARFEIDIEVADLKKAIPIVASAKAQSYDIIMSRGGTSNVIRERVSTPVVDIPVSGYDILRVLTLVKNSNSKVAVIGFPNICRGAAAVLSVLDFEIPIYSIERAAEVPATLQKAFKHGATLVLGDVVTVSTAQEMGYNGILITSGQESVLEALSEVERIHEVVMKARKNEPLFGHILEHQRTGVLVADSQGVLRYANPAAALLLGYEAGAMAGMSLAGIEPIWERYLEEAALDAALPVRKTKWFNNRQLHIEIIAPGATEDRTFLIYMYPLEEKAKNRFSSNFEVTDRIGTFGQIIGSSVVIRQAIKRAAALAATEKPVWIAGEAGTGKHLFTQAIHSASPHKSDSLYVLPCHQLTDIEQESLLFGSDSEPGLLYAESVGTICLQQIQHVSSQLQQRLLEAIQAGIAPRLIVTSLLPRKTLIKKEEVHPEFAHLFTDSSFVVPPLRDRLEDIGDIARVLIADYNSQHGKQIVGVRQEVLDDDLMQRLWPGNVKQLTIVLETMLAFTTGHYLGPKEAKEGWLKVKDTLQMEASNHNSVINLSGTWDQIERRVLLEILQNEGMNQSKTAKRLGINRSTLWRKLKNMLQN
ncbi:sigma-54-dependent Fis family transcriptional regulator [Paenibacillus xerothermodurans]|uniref:Winged helix-turn-helix transcriptional regulator n=1 Tax=Paenibacillus xerothermodurans TaxID=1977292 RepID=A0A2W1N4R1_PAEXE|nr:sigma-54-dependent Fis family transcriptional regulator [Paenibacillus xerothermodurans]PZE19337.1 winged helix-turn-helix transcriptional regulator [Paenibacillus xerothermodurans]